MATRQTLLAELGGRDGLATAVGELYRRILADRALAPYFENVPMPALHAHMIDFLAAALAEPADDYRGQPLDLAHARLAVSDGAFDRVVAHVHAVLSSSGAPAPTVDAALARLAPLRSLIVAAPV